MGYGVLVGILRMKVWFFCFAENTIRKSSLSEEDEFLNKETQMIFVPFPPRDVG